MPQKDLYHEPVRRALIKDGWTITDDPFVIQYKELRLYADLAAERPLAAEKSGRKIVVEIKVFGTPSPVTELERAIGQYALYRSALKRMEPERELFLAIAEDIYQDFFAQLAIREVMADYGIRLLVFEPTGEEILSWID
jgi:hypothetical protein